MVTSFTSPHDICQLVRGERIPGGPIGALPEPENCPPAPINYAPPDDETDSMTLMRRSYHNTRRFPVADFDEARWRQMRWGYYRLIERADREIGKMLTALKKAGLEQNTLIIFTADHGDCTGAHRFAQKTVFYDESSRIPFILTFPGKVSPGTTKKLVNVGTDTLPTMLDFAGLEIPHPFQGLSLIPVCENPASADWREYIVISNHMVQGGPIDGEEKAPTCRGRMVRTEDFKYAVYDLGNHRESLVDMKNNLHEMQNLARNPEYNSELRKHQRILRAYAKKTGDSEALDILEGR